MLCKQRAQCAPTDPPSQPAVGNRPSHTRTGGSDSPAPPPGPASPGCFRTRGGLPGKAGSFWLRSVRKRTGAKTLAGPSERGCSAGAALPAGAAAGAAGCRELEALTEPPEQIRGRSLLAETSGHRDRQRVRAFRRPVTSRAGLGIPPYPPGSRGDRRIIATTHPPRRAEEFSVSGGREDGGTPRSAAGVRRGRIRLGRLRCHRRGAALRAGGGDRAVRTRRASPGQRCAVGSAAACGTRDGGNVTCRSRRAAPEGPSKAVMAPHGPSEALMSPHGPSELCTEPQSPARPRIPTHGLTEPLTAPQSLARPCRAPHSSTPAGVGRSSSQHREGGVASVADVRHLLEKSDISLRSASP